MAWLSIPLLLAAGGAGAVAIAVSARKASASNAQAPRVQQPHQDAGASQASPNPRAEPQEPYGPPAPSADTGRLLLKTTKYWPFAATESEREMQGGVHGAAKWKGRGAEIKAVDPGTGRRPVLYPIEDFLAGKTPYVSLAGDPNVWPFGQRLEIDAFPGVVFRVVDTGGNFKGSNKKYRIKGAEPIDVCVRLKSTKIPDTSGARIVRGDNWEGGALVAVRNLRDQSVVAGAPGYAILGGDLARPSGVPEDATAWDETGWYTTHLVTPLVDCAEHGRAFARAALYTTEDEEALARAIESSCPKSTIAEKQAVAWVCRNRALKQGVPLREMLAPEGTYGPRGDEGRDFVSTASAPSVVSSQVSRAVLRLDASEDPTGGATEFWNPSQQRRARAVADAHAVFGADALSIPSESEVRAALLGAGLVVVDVVGDVELLA